MICSKEVKVVIKMKQRKKKKKRAKRSHYKSEVYQNVLHKVFKPERKCIKTSRNNYQDSIVTSVIFFYILIKPHLYLQ